MRKIGIVGFLLLAALLTTGCRPEKQSSSGMSAIDACTIVRVDEIESILGLDVQQLEGYPKQAEGHEGRLTDSHCRFAIVGSQRILALNVTRSTVMPFPRTMEQFMESARKTGEVVGEGFAETMAGSVEIPGLGHLAVWNPELGTLTIYDQEVRVILSITGEEAPGERPDRERLIRLAQRVLERV